MYAVADPASLVGALNVLHLDSEVRDPHSAASSLRDADIVSDHLHKP
jgi:hypothetical protein